MSQLVKTKRQANFKDFKGFGAFKGLVKQKNVVFNSFACKLLQCTLSSADTRGSRNCVRLIEVSVQEEFFS
jgi:hypothetical protein